jgi:hypothetical protein
MDDHVQVGSIGLLNAIERYDPGNGSAFSSFAVPTIAAEFVTDVEEHLNARGVAAGHYAVSLDRTMGADDADGADGRRSVHGDRAGLRCRRRRLHAVGIDGGARRPDTRDLHLETQLVADAAR